MSLELILSEASDDGEPYWFFELYDVEDEIGFGSADDIDTCFAMAKEMKQDYENGSIQKANK